MITQLDYRLNAYAGIASAYVITDTAEEALTGVPGNSKAIPYRQLPIIVQDKVFIPSGFNDRPGLVVSVRREASGMPTPTTQNSMLLGLVDREGTRVPIIRRCPIHPWCQNFLATRCWPTALFIPQRWFNLPAIGSAY